MPDYVLIESGDGDDAENVATMLGHPAITDYVHPNEQFTVTNIDETNDNFDMSGGKAYIGYDGGLDTASNETRNQLMFTVEMPSVTDIPLNDVDATNYVWLDAQVGTPDSGRWMVTNTNSPPTTESLLIVTILAEDTNSDGSSENVQVVDYKNRGPDMIAEMLEHPETEPIDLNGSSFENAGHDDVDVPQVRDLTVEDWESGTLDTDVWSGATAEASVQPTYAESGSYALQIAGGSSGAYYQIYSHSGLETYPQAGDEFATYAYLTDTDDRWFIFFGLQNAPGGNSFPEDMYYIEIQANNDDFQFFVRQAGNSTNVFSPQNADISSHLNEWLELNIEWGVDGDFTVTLTDASGAELASGSGTDTTWTEGGVGYNIRNNNVAPTAYFDSHTLTRRSPEYTSETKKGITELGNEVTPSGSIQTGPTTSSTNAERAIYQDAPVDSTVTAGTQSKLALLQSGLHPAMFMERTLDGQGGAYGHQLQAPLGRFSRLNANLSFEYNSLADAPHYTSAQGGSAHSFTLTGDLPRRLRVSIDGSGGNVYGGIVSTLITSYSSLGGFRLNFHDVSFSNNDTSSGYNEAFLGFTDQTPDTNIEGTGSGVYWNLEPWGSSDVIDKVESGTSERVGGYDLDWTQNHDLSIEFTGNEFRAFYDGVDVMGTIDFSPNGAFRPILSIEDNTSNSVSETLEVAQITIEPLPEVLQ